MLSRGGGAVALQKVVSKVSDLPSPLDAETGQRIIVRETEEVYGLNATTRMWEVIGTLKRVGGKRPEELAAHVDSKGNPHGTSLQDVLDAGTVVKVTTEIVLNGKGPASQIRLMSGNSALRVGPDAGSKDGALWLNLGAGTKTILRAVNAKGDDMLVLSTDGIVSGGSATFYGGFKGLAEFEDEIVANEGVQSAEGHDLLLSGDKAVALNVGGQLKAYLTPDKLTLHGGLAMKGDLRVGGVVRASLNPAPSLKDLTLGVDKARWSSAAVGDLDVAGQVLIRVPDNAKAAPLQVVGSAPGHGAVLTALGALGLGTDDPKARLDVRGAVLIDGELTHDQSGHTCGDWSVSYGANLLISCKGKTVLQGGDDGVVLAGARVDGDLVVNGALSLSGISGLQKQVLWFKSDGSATYKATSHQFGGGLTVDVAKGEDLLTLKSAGDTLFSVASDGALLGSKLGRQDAPWAEASFETTVTVGETVYRSGRIAHKGEFTIDAPTLSVGPTLRLTGQRPKIEVLNTLDFVGHGGKVELALGGPNCGLDFEAKHFEVSGVDVLNVGSVKAKALAVEGDASFCGGAAAVSKQGLKLTGDLQVGSLAFKKLEEVLDLSTGPYTKFQIPAGVRVEAVLVRLKTDVEGARFLRVGDPSDPDRFSGPTTELKNGALIRGLNHWSQGRAVQKVEAPVVVSTDAPSTGKVLVTVLYVDSAAL